MHIHRSTVCSSNRLETTKVSYGRATKWSTMQLLKMRSRHFGVLGWDYCLSHLHPILKCRGWHLVTLHFKSSFLLMFTHWRQQVMYKYLCPSSCVGDWDRVFGSWLLHGQSWLLCLVWKWAGRWRLSFSVFNLAIPLPLCLSKKCLFPPPRPRLLPKMLR